MKIQTQPDTLVNTFEALLEEMQKQNVDARANPITVMFSNTGEYDEQNDAMFIGTAYVNKTEEEIVGDYTGEYPLS